MAETLKDQLYSTLKNGIESGALEQGLVLLESNIARIFSTSRSPVRETLQKLFDEELICRFDGRGYLVGSAPSEVIRRQISVEEIKTVGTVKVSREMPWSDLIVKVERDAVLSSMMGRWEVNELKLAQCFNVSRAVTQHILVRLQSLGVVEHERYSGWHVVPLNDQRLNALYEARIVLEPYMVERATELIPTETLNHYIDEIQTIASLYPNVKPEQLDSLENDLHKEVLEFGANNEILAMLARTRPILFVSKHLLGDHLAMPENDPFMQEHLDILEHMKRGDGVAAGEALKLHLSNSKSKVLARLKQYREESEPYSTEYLKWISLD